MHQCVKPAVCSETLAASCGSAYVPAVKHIHTYRICWVWLQRSAADEIKPNFLNKTLARFQTSKTGFNRPLLNFKEDGLRVQTLYPLAVQKLLKWKAVRFCVCRSLSEAHLGWAAVNFTVLLGTALPSALGFPHYRLWCLSGDQT